MAIDEERKTYKIGEVCRMAQVQPYVLRYWETEFPALAPSKGGGGQRAYTQREVDVVLRIKQLLYSEGFTIAGAKKKLEAELREGERAVIDAAPEPLAAALAETRSATRFKEAIVRARRELRELLEMLR